MCPAQWLLCFTSPGFLTKKGAKMIQWVKAAVAKPGDTLNSTQGPTVEGENHVLKVFCDLYTNAVVHNAPPTCTHKINKKGGWRNLSSQEMLSKRNKFDS